MTVTDYPPRMTALLKALEKSHAYSKRLRTPNHASHFTNMKVRVRWNFSASSSSMYRDDCSSRRLATQPCCESNLYTSRCSKSMREVIIAASWGDLYRGREINLIDMTRKLSTGLRRKGRGIGALELIRRIDMHDLKHYRRVHRDNGKTTNNESMDDRWVISDAGLILLIISSHKTT